ncbi:hypothetical protein EF917_22550 [Streptomyces sp. WAC00469]|nr:hypothetical protein EF917_22550 [Streptomyces sp. WAC00469]
MHATGTTRTATAADAARTGNGEDTTDDMHATGEPVTTKDMHATGAPVTTDDMHATGEPVTTKDMHATSEPFEPAQ